MESYKFIDRPNYERIKATAEEFYQTDENLALAFLDFQWSYREMQKQYDNLLQRFSLTESRFIILMFLKRAKSNMLLPSEISEKLGASRPTVSKLLKAMEKNKLVEKTSSVIDKRSVYFKITDYGLEVLDNFVPSNFRAVETIFSFLESEDISTLTRLLEKLNQGTNKLKKEME
ncbi:MarR family winged helix-turn-helix transcriptional regulator [Lactococcus lactis]|uniref:MarR family winged helix-turn-helix transcriptional regulator n=1 Tax=Lactococcus lactis TaxID=1358 RepID=UPI00398E753E